MTPYSVMTSTTHQRKIMLLTASILKQFNQPSNALRQEAMLEAKAVVTRKNKLLLLLAD